MLHLSHLMDLRLKDKLVLVTGSTSGIGKATARAFLREEARVIVHGRSLERLQPVVEELRSLGQVTGMAAPLDSSEGATALIQQIESYGELDILVNNAGIFEVKPFAEISDADWLHYFNVNVMSAVRLSRFFLPKMIRRNSGVVLLMASEAGVKPLPQMIHYSVTKTALIGLARGMAELTKGTAVRVNSVLAGPTWTEGVENYFQGLARAKELPVDHIMADYFTRDEPTSLIQRFVQVDEVASAILLLATNPALNGVAQRVEGGIIRSL